jgi:hypothetical protein
VTAVDQIVRHLLEDEGDFDDADWKDVEPMSIHTWIEQAGFQRGDHPSQWILKVTRRRQIILTELPGGDWDAMVVINGQAADNARYTVDNLRYWLENGGFGLGKPKMEAEEEDFGDEDWKDVTPDVAANSVERWAFTDYELHHPKRCSSDNEFYVDVEGCDLEVIVLRNGTVTNLWGDRTGPVPGYIRELADEVETLRKPVRLRQDPAQDYYADTWRDVYVDQHGAFIAFVDPPKFLPKLK